MGSTRIGTKIHAARSVARLTQEEVCARTDGLFRVTLADIERGNVTPSKELADAIMAAIETLRKEREDGIASRV